jgi:hypothetical protein
MGDPVTAWIESLFSLLPPPMPILGFWQVIGWILVKIIVPMAISMAIGLLLMRKPKGAKPAGKDQFDLPTSEEDRPYPVVWGKRRVTSPNAVTPLLEFYAKKKKVWANKTTGSKITAAHLYDVTFQMGVCQANIDGILQIWVADTCVWPMADDPDIEAGDGITTATVDAGGVFGGWEQEGGIAGPVHIQYGGDLQTVDWVIAYWLGADEPPSRGFTGVILNLVYIGTQPYLKPWSFLCKRTDQLTDGLAMWYLAKANIGDDDLNPMHIVYELLTSTRIGLGRDPSLIGDSFTSCADTLYDEEFGLSCVWDWAPDGIEEIIAQIEEIVEGKLYIDPVTGKFEFALLRDVGG